MESESSPRPLLSVVITSYNDEEAIRPFYDAIVATLEAQDTYEFELIYVDDGSADGSQATLAELAQADARITYIEFMRNFGQGRAQFAGLQASRGDVVVTMDGDYQYEPDAILKLADACRQGYDMASGIRTDRHDEAGTVWASKFGHMIIRNILRVPVEDFGASKAFARPFVESLLHREHYFSDVYAPALSLGPRLVNVPVSHLPRPGGRSHWNVWMRIRVLLDLYVEYATAQFDLPFRAGVVLCALSALYGVGGLLWRAAFQSGPAPLAVALVALLLLLIGLQLVAFALLMTFVTRIYKQNIFDKPYVVRRTIKRGREVLAVEPKQAGSVAHHL